MGSLAACKRGVGSGTASIPADAAAPHAAHAARSDAQPNAHSTDGAPALGTAGLSPGNPPHPFLEEPHEPGPWVDGHFGRLRLRTLRSPRHDADYGATAIEQETPAPGGGARKVVKTEKEGLWRVIAYLDDIGAYLLGGLFERGAWLPLDTLVYVDERTGVWRESYVDRTRWMAMAAVPSAHGRFVAFVADPQGTSFELEVLDTRTDTMVHLGKAPAPPPLEKDDRDLCPAGGGRDLFTWGEGTDGFVDMDAGIITFPDDHTLAVSYGADRCRGRSRSRHVRRWDLPTAFSRGPKVVPATND